MFKVSKTLTIAITCIFLTAGSAEHTDNVGGATNNQTLSEKRAGAVMTYLTDEGIVASRLRAAGYGQQKPLAENSTTEGRVKNRRVELKLSY